MSYPTTRRHPRTLDEAFPDCRAAWHEGWQRPQHSRWAGPLLAVAIAVALTLVIIHWIDWSLT